MSTTSYTKSSVPLSGTPIGKVLFPTVESKKDTTRMMKAVEWYSDKVVQIVERPVPLVTDPTDAIIRMTNASIGGADLHLYNKEVTGVKRGDILGHEFMGIVESIGPEVTNFKIGDKVVVSSIISCGCCEYCKKQKFGNCDCTNSAKETEPAYGHRVCGMFGSSSASGGFDGGHAEYVRVPFADVNMLKISGKFEDERYLFLSDTLTTAFHAIELSEVKPGDTVAVWGCGPVGLAIQMWAKYKGASRVVGIDGVDYRLKTAVTKLGSDIIDYRDQDVVASLQKLIPGGPDVCIDAVGFRFPKSLLHKFERALKLESDSPQILVECIYSVKKGGIVTVVGDYYALANHFPIGAIVQKGIFLKGGSLVPIQKYWKDIFKLVESGKVDPSFLVTHRMDLNEAPEAYRIYDDKQEQSLKIVMHPRTITTPTTSPI